MLLPFKLPPPSFEGVKNLITRTEIAKTQETRNYSTITLMSVRTPAYALDPLKGFMAYLKNTTQLLEVSMRAIAMIGTMPKMVEAIGNAVRGTENWDEESHERLVKKVYIDAAFCIDEYSAGFPLFHEFTLVGMWGAFEAEIEDLIIAMLCDEPVLLRNDLFSKVRIPLADFENLDKEDRMRTLLKELQRTLRSDQRQGVNGFESILGAVGLSAEVDAKIRESIWEMHHARNVIVHRRSCADRAFVTACPKFGVKIGDRVVITKERLQRYVADLGRYATALVYRMGGNYGVDMGKHED